MTKFGNNSFLFAKEVKRCRNKTSAQNLIKNCTASNLANTGKKKAKIKLRAKERLKTQIDTEINKKAGLSYFLVLLAHRLRCCINAFKFSFPWV